MLKMKAVVGKILQSYEVFVDPEFEPELAFEAVLKSINGIPLKFVERK